MHARDFMTRAVVTVSPEETLGEVTRKFLERDISGAPVLNHAGKLVGVITESDILRRLESIVEHEVGKKFLSSTTNSLGLFVVVSELHPDVAREVFRQLQNSTVEEAVTPKVVFVKPEDTLEAVTMALIENDINRVPVVEDGKVVGIISRADITRAIARH